MAKSVAERVKAILAEVLDVEVENLLPDARIIEDLHADSIHLVDILAGLENSFRIEIPEADISVLTTVDKTIQYMEAKVGEA